jgi:hypothetical protein
MLEIKLDTTKVVKTVDGMIERIAHFKRVDIGAELSAWQIEDLHRHRPFTMRSRAKGIAKTKIRPHSLAEMLRSQGLQQRITGVRARGRGWKLRLRHIAVHLRRHWSTRPILRSEMYEVLERRMHEALTRLLVWKK